MLSLNLPDKVLSGVNQSYTFTSDEGAPAGSVSVGGSDVEHRIVPLGPPKDEPSGTDVMKFKVSFLIPDGSVGKKLVLKFKAGEASVDEEQDIIAE